MNDGEADGKGGRWCATCAHSHGPLYVCPNYSAELRAKLEVYGAELRDALRDPAWCDKQRRAGVPEVAIEIMGAFAGVTPRTGKPS